MKNHNKHNQQNNQNPPYSETLADIPRLFRDSEIPINDNPARQRYEALRDKESISYTDTLKEIPSGIFRDDETPINDNTTPHASRPIGAAAADSEPDYAKTWPKNYTPDSYFTHTWPASVEPDYARTWPKDYNPDARNAAASRQETAPSPRVRRIRKRLGGIAAAASLNHFLNIGKKDRTLQARLAHR